MKALILCGGKGTRLRPLTYEIPKSLIPIRGKPVTEHLLDLLKKYKIEEAILAIGHMKDKIKEYFENGENQKIKINYVEEDTPLGTAGPIKLAKNILNETFIASNGDELKDINIDDMLKQHKKTKALVTIALTPREDPSIYGVAKLQGNKILEFIEKPKKEEAPSNFINSGFYIIEPEVIDIIGEGFQMLEKDIFPKIASMGRLYGYKFKGQWFDTGTWQRYEEAIKNWNGLT